MPQYFYIAKSLTGEEKSGFLEAMNQAELARILRQEGFILVRTITNQQADSRFFKFFSLRRRVSLTEKLLFTRNLQVMIGAGFVLPRALQVLAFQTKNKKFQKILLNITQEIIKGKSFSDCLANYPEVFSELFQNMIKLGEESGSLDEVLAVLTRQLEKEKELGSKIKSAFIYPTIIFLIMIIIGILMLVLVVPKLAETFAELNISLPLTTRLVIGLGNFLVTQWYWVVFVGFLLFLFCQLILKTKLGKKVVDAVVLKIPVISSLVKKINSSRTMRSLGSLIEAGVPLVRSLEITANVLSNSYYRQPLLVASEEVKKGKKLSEIISSYQNIYSPLFIEIIRVGEETGETASVLTKLADFLEEEVAYATKNLTSVVEPFLILLVGVAIGFFAISLVQPMYSMLEAL